MPVRYVDVASDDDGIGFSSQEILHSPIKKPKTSKKSITRTVKGTLVSM